MIKLVTIRAINIYKKFISPVSGLNCRFYPSCSDYVVEALDTNNFFKAFSKILWRILRCNPFSSGGYDPVK